MPGSYSLPNPLSPATNDPLTSLPIRQNFQSIQSQLNNADGAALQALSVQEASLSLNANPRLRATNAGQSYFVSGLNPVVPGSGLVLTIPAGVAYVNGYYVAYAGGTKTVTANQDAYLDIDINGTITAPGVANNAAAPALTASSARFAKVVANTNIVQVLQESINNAPVSPNTLNWFGFDSLGNAVYNTNPYNQTLGLVEIYAGVTNSPSSVTAVAGLSLTVIIPVNARRVRITGWGGAFTAGALTTASLYICDGSVATVLGYNQSVIAVSGYTATAAAQVIVTPAAGSKTYLLGMSNTAVTATTLNAASNQPAFILVEAI